MNETVADSVGAVNTMKANSVRWKGKTSDAHFGGDVVAGSNGRINSDGDGNDAFTLLTGGYAQMLFADGHVAKIEDVGGIDENPDSWLGP